MNSDKYIKSCGTLNKHYLERIEQTIDKALREHPRTTALRIDLKTPIIQPANDIPDETSFAYVDATIISRFIASLKAKIKAYLKMKKKEGKRVHKTSVRFVWVREFSPKTGRKHYHVLLLLNKDTFNYLGNYNEDNGALVTMISGAWMSALNLPLPGSGGLVHIPENPCYYLFGKEGKESKTYGDLIYRTSYMAKEETKYKDDGERNFGCSQK